MNPFLWVLIVLVGLFVVMYVVAMIKRPGSRYMDKPKEQNPMQGKMVRSVENPDKKKMPMGYVGIWRQLVRVSTKPRCMRAL